jgi:ribosomal protein L29
MAKKTDYSKKEKGELVKELGKLREELRTLRFTAAGARTKDAHAKAKVRKDIACVMTALTAKKKTAYHL